jgi:hypothetical protein
VVGLSLGLVSCALGYLTFFSAHSAAASNENLLPLPPWSLLLAGAGIAALRKKRRAFRWAFWSAAAAAASTLAGLIRLTLHAPQANAQELAFALPLWLGVAFSALVCARAIESRALGAR